MNERQKRVAGLLKRFEFTDFARFVSMPAATRAGALRLYVDREFGDWSSYSGFRSMVADIAGVTRGLDLSGKLTLDNVYEGLKLRCKKKDLDSNRKVAAAYFEHIRRPGLEAYCDHPRTPLYIARDRTISMRVEHYIVENERGAFQFVNPRRNAFDPEEAQIAMSLIHWNFVSGDFAEFEVEIVELGAPYVYGPRGGRKLADNREPRTIALHRDTVREPAWLEEQANSIYSILMKIADDPK